MSMRMMSVIAGTILVVGVAGCGSSSSSSTTSAGSTPSPSASSDASPSASAPSVQILDFRSGADGEGIFIEQPSQVSQLEGTTAAFQAFIADGVQKLLDDGQCPDAAKGYGVDKYATNGYAIGGVNECGGYAAIWGVRNGQWQELMGTQDAYDCSELHRARVPVGLLADGKCYDASTQTVISYEG